MYPLAPCESVGRRQNTHLIWVNGEECEVQKHLSLLSAGTGSDTTQTSAGKSTTTSRKSSSAVSVETPWIPDLQLDLGLVCWKTSQSTKPLWPRCAPYVVTILPPPFQSSKSGHNLSTWPTSSPSNEKGGSTLLLSKPGATFWLCTAIESPLQMSLNTTLHGYGTPSFMIASWVPHGIPSRAEFSPSKASLCRMSRETPDAMISLASPLSCSPLTSRTHTGSWLKST